MTNVMDVHHGQYQREAKTNGLDSRDEIKPAKRTLEKHLEFRGEQRCHETTLEVATFIRLGSQCCRAAAMVTSQPSRKRAR